MAEKHKHHFINWIDGMKINKDHFIGTENATIYQQYLIGKTFINPYNFGILPGDEGKPPLDVSVEIDGDSNVSVRVNRCIAITSGGFIVDLETSVHGMPDFDLSLKDFNLEGVENVSGEFYIVLKINPYGRLPVGNADPNESPPRHPFVIPEYDLSIVPVEQMNKSGYGQFFVVIGKIVTKDNIPVADKDYIPPSSKVISDERLLAIDNKLIEFFTKLEKEVMVIIHKIHIKQQKSPLASSVLHFADRIAAFQGLHITKQRLFLKHQPPVTLFEAISQFARLLRNTFNTQPAERREEMITYFSDWCNLKEGELEELMSNMVKYQYDHFEIAAVMSKMMGFIDTMSVLFETLSHLEYIGKRRDTQIYIKEEEKSKRSFLADD